MRGGAAEGLGFQGHSVGIERREAPGDHVGVDEIDDPKRRRSMISLGLRNFFELYQALAKTWRLDDVREPMVRS